MARKHPVSHNWWWGGISRGGGVRVGMGVGKTHVWSIKMNLKRTDVPDTNGCRLNGQTDFI